MSPCKSIFHRASMFILLSAIFAATNVNAEDFNNVPQATIDWCRNAIKDVEAGNTLSMSTAAHCYEYGFFVKQDIKRSTELWEKSAAQGNVASQAHVGLMYERGRVVEKNLSKAVYWYQKAADQGYGVGQLYLGMMYLKGEGVVKNAEKASELFSKVKAKQANDRVFPNGDNYHALVIDPEKEAEWNEIKAGQGDVAALVRLGDLYHGKGANILSQNRGEAEKYFAKSFEWYKKAATAAQGDAYAQFRIAMDYKSGPWWAGKDEVKARNWFEQSAKQGYVHAQRTIGEMYESGKGGEKNAAKAMEWYLKAAAQKDFWSHMKIAALYQDGIGVNQDGNKAIEWYVKAGVIDPEFGVENSIGLLYAFGIGVAKDPLKADEWFGKLRVKQKGVCKTLGGWNQYWPDV